MKEILAALPPSSVVHVANSMAIRYVDWIGLPESVQWMHANRGVNGIDGCLSTAVGAALAQSDDRLHVLVIGDMAFLYDRNALWHRHLPKNLRIVLLNDHGGGIFRLIEGSAGLPECDKFFVAGQPLTMEHTALQHRLGYHRADSISSFRSVLPAFLSRQRAQPALLEAVIADPDEEVRLHRQFVAALRE